MALRKIGMTGIAQGNGYGEQKDVMPVIGQSTPTVQYNVRTRTESILSYRSKGATRVWK